MHAFNANPPPLSTGDDGVIRVAGTRVVLEVLVTAFDAGATPEEIAQQFPSLDLATVYAVIAYLLQDRASVDDYIRKRRDAADTVRYRVE